jgi:hypothetical protein
VAHARQESGAGCHSGDDRGPRRGHGNDAPTHPFAMTYPAGASPTDEPAPQIHVSHLRSCGDADTDERAVPDRQLWGTVLGVLGQG